METTFGLAHVWLEGDWVTRAVAVVLLTMSVVTWVVMLEMVLAVAVDGACCCC